MQHRSLAYKFSEVEVERLAIIYASLKGQPPRVRRDNCCQNMEGELLMHVEGELGFGE